MSVIQTIALVFSVLSLVTSCWALRYSHIALRRIERSIGL